MPLVLWAFRDGRNKQRLLSSVVDWIPVLQAIWQSNDAPSALAGLWNYVLMVTPDLSEHDFAEVAAALPQSQGTIMANSLNS